MKSGLTNVTDLAFNGRYLYAVQISTEGLLNGPTGSVVKVKRGGKVADDHKPIASNLFAPYGIAVRSDSAYITTGSVAPGAGKVLTTSSRPTGSRARAARNSWAT